MYALVINNTIEAVQGRLPRGADADGQWIEPVTEANAASCGWFPVVDVARPADTTTDTHDRTVQLVDGTPTVVWTQRAWTVDELAARQAEANRQTIDAAIAGALAELQQIIDGPTVATVPAGTLTTAQLSTGLRTLRDEVALNRAGVKRVAGTLRHTVRLVRGDYDAVD